MKKLTADNHEHTFSVAGIPDNTTYCTRCRLLKSTIEQTKPTRCTCNPRPKFDKGGHAVHEDDCGLWKTPKLKPSNQLT